MAAIIGLAFGYSASHVPKGVITLTESIRSRQASKQITSNPIIHPDPISNSYVYPNGSGRASYSFTNGGGGSFRGRQGVASSSRSVTFEDDVDEYEEDELSSRSSLGLRGLST